MMQFYCKFPSNQGFCFGQSSGGFNTLRSTAEGWVNQESVKAKVKAVQSGINLNEKFAGASAPHKVAKHRSPAIREPRRGGAQPKTDTDRLSASGGTGKESRELHDKPAK